MAKADTLRAPRPASLAGVLSLLLVTASLASASARDATQGSWLVGGYGMAGVLDEEKVHGVFLHWRSSPIWHGFSIWAESDISTRGAPLFAGGGILLHTALGEDWSVAVSSGPGLFEAEDWLELGSRLEFFSSIEFSRRIADSQRISAAFGHISNAGFGRHNPGSEIIKAGYQVEWGRLNRARW